jgi:hypothetical protein
MVGAADGMPYLPAPHLRINISRDSDRANRSLAAPVLKGWFLRAEEQEEARRSCIRRFFHSAELRSANFLERPNNKDLRALRLFASAYSADEKHEKNARAHFLGILPVDKLCRATAFFLLFFLSLATHSLPPSIPPYPCRSSSPSHPSLPSCLTPLLPDFCQWPAAPVSLILRYPLLFPIIPNSLIYPYTRASH